MTGDEALRHAAELGAEYGAGFLSEAFDNGSVTIQEVFEATRTYYDGITREYRPHTPENVRLFMLHLKESLLA
jgi:hypothetical protein